MKAKLAMAQGRCDAQRHKSQNCVEKEIKLLDEQRWDESPSVIAYDVNVLLTGSRPSVTAVSAQLSCWPAD